MENFELIITSDGEKYLTPKKEMEVRHLAIAKLISNHLDEYKTILETMKRDAFKHEMDKLKHIQKSGEGNE